MTRHARRTQAQQEHAAGLNAYQKFRAQQIADDRPLTYVRVDATGQATADLNRSRDQEAVTARADGLNNARRRRTP